MATFALFGDWLAVSHQIKPLGELMVSKNIPICFRQYAKQEE